MKLRKKHFLKMFYMDWRKFDFILYMHIEIGTFEKFIQTSSVVESTRNVTLKHNKTASKVRIGMNSLSVLFHNLIKVAGNIAESRS